MNNLEEAMKYIKGYCNKHTECEPFCKLFNPNTNQCFLADGSIPADWHIVMEGDESERER